MRCKIYPFQLLKTICFIGLIFICEIHILDYSDALDVLKFSKSNIKVNVWGEGAGQGIASNVA